MCARTVATYTGPRSRVVAGMSNLGPANHAIESVPKMGVVVPLHNVFAPVGQVAVAQQKAQPAVVQIVLVVALDGVRNKRHAHLSFDRCQLWPL
jgi:hypothetical protein